MPEAIMIREYGASDVMHLETVDIAAPQANELRIRQTAIGINFHDIYVRAGLYQTLVPPGVPGCEATGIIEEIGCDVQGYKVGDRVAYVLGPPYGAYASHRLLPATAAVPVPDNMDDAIIAGNFLRALTVDMLTQRVVRLEAGMTVLVQAAAGGVGRLLCQMASHIGATVIGTVGSAEKAETAKACGCADTILYREVDFSEEVLKITKGKGVDVAYDSIGADTFAGSLNYLSKRGYLVNFGQSSGAVDPITMTTLAQKSLTISRPILFHYLEDPLQYQKMAVDVFAAFSDRILTADRPETFALADAGKAHDRLESRAATNSLVLIP